MKRAAIALVLLGGCAHKPPQTVVEVREVPVIRNVPTPVRCVNPADIPREPPQVRDKFNGDARHDLEVLAPNARELRTWGREMRSLLEKCTGRARPR